MRMEIPMPELGYEVEEGTISAWLVAVGDEVAVGQVIAEIETDKTTLDVESLHAGTLAEIAHEVGAAVPVGQALAYVEVAG